MRFRQVHLDFHTSECIPGIGKKFSKHQFQQMLQLGHVDSITVFAKCHHGWAYHPTKENEMHPELDYDLLGAMIDAAHEIDVKTPVYISAGLDEKIARRYPQWLIRDAQDQTNWVQGFMTPGYHQFCFNTPYLDILLKQVHEVVSQYEVDGIFLDIVGVRECYCQYCVDEIRKQGDDPRDIKAMQKLWEKTYANYTSRVKDVIHGIKPGLPIFHNGGHLRRGRRDLAHMNTHLELESLPTGGWGYDHFPLSARYAQTLGLDYIGQTGKFHTMWGEFGGFKHPNALRYETALSLANGARCSIGDQMSPDGWMDPATYKLIGAAYQEVEQKESWCTDTTNIADVALLSVQAVDTEEWNAKGNLADSGACRMLLEGKLLFDVIDTEADFSNYKVLILPDQIKITASLHEKINQFTQTGGKLLVTGSSGLNEQGDAFVLDLGFTWQGENPYKPDYFKPHFALKSLDETAFVFYSPGQKITLTTGQELGRRENPYFNRDVFHFCSHQHTPNSGEYGGPGMVESSNGIYIAWNVFEDYATKGSLALKETVLYALNRLLPLKTLETDLPSQGIVTIQEQANKQRWIHHLLYAVPVARGDGINVIEDIIPVHEVKVAIRVAKQVKKVTLVPQQKELAFEQSSDLLSYAVPEIDGHQMVAIQF